MPLPFANRRGREERYFSVSYTPVFDDGGRVAGVFVSMLDSTDKVVAEQTYRDLLSLISPRSEESPQHRPGGAELIDRRSKDGEQAATVRKHTATIRRSADRMARLVADVADYAKLRYGRLPMEKGVVRVSELVEPVAAAHKVLAEQKGQTFEVWVAAPDDPVVCDGDRIRRSLSNVLSNAVKFTPEGGRVALRVEPRGPAVVFRVEDTGPGIAPDERDGVFERRPGRVRKTKGQGPGLGMPIARAIVRAHGGDIAVEPRESGTTVVVSVPSSPGPSS